MMRDRTRPLAGHLRELRWRLLVVVLAAIAGAIVCAVFFRPLIEILERPAAGYLSDSGGPIFTEVTEVLGVTVKVALLGGMVLATPVLVYEAMMFVAPGLTGRERRYIILLIPGALLCFAGGVAFAYFLLLPPMLFFLLHFGEGVATPAIRISAYINLIVTLLSWMGAVFETPLIMFTLARMGLVSWRTLARGRRIAVVMSFLLGAIITPTFDPVNQALVALPLIVLYEAGIWLARLVGRGAEAGELGSAAEASGSGL